MKLREFIPYILPKIKNSEHRTQNDVIDITGSEQNRLMDGVMLFLQILLNLHIITLTLIMFSSPLILLTYLCISWLDLSSSEIIFIPFWIVALFYFLIFSMEKKKKIRTGVIKTIENNFFEKSLKVLESTIVKDKNLPYPKVTAGFMRLRTFRTQESAKVIILGAYAFCGVAYFILNTLDTETSSYLRPLFGVYLFLNNVFGGSLDVFGIYTLIDLDKASSEVKTVLWVSALSFSFLVGRYIKTINSIRLKDTPDAVQQYILQTLPKNHQNYLKAIY